MAGPAVPAEFVLGNNPIVFGNERHPAHIVLEGGDPTEKSFFDRYVDLATVKPKYFIYNPLIKLADWTEFVATTFFSEDLGLKAGPGKGLYDALTVGKALTVIPDVAKDIQKTKDGALGTIEAFGNWWADDGRQAERLADRRVQLWTEGGKELLYGVTELAYDGSELVDLGVKLGVADLSKETLGLVGVIGSAGTVIGSTARIAVGIHDIATHVPKTDLPVGVDPAAVDSLEVSITWWNLGKSVALFVTGTLGGVAFFTGIVIATPIFTALGTVVLITNIVTSWLGDKRDGLMEPDYVARVIPRIAVI